MSQTTLPHSAQRCSHLARILAIGVAVALGCSSTAEQDAQSDAQQGAQSDAQQDAEQDSTTQGPVAHPNLLLVIADDLGLDASVCHSLVADPGTAPRLKALCERGVVFDNAWAAPTCSPTRASILTGRHSFRTGVGAQVVGDTSAVLGLDEFTLPQALEAALPGVYTSACIGKWHLSDTSNGGADHPLTAGFSHYAGSWRGALTDYYSWDRTVDGVTTTSSEYATSVQVNDARDWIAAQQGPWFVWLAFNAPHSPFHVPPLDLHSYDALEGQAVPTRPLDHYHAMIEAMDTELGRLLDGLSPEVLDNTWIIFLGDNGTPRAVVQSPIVAAHAKDSLYQGGVGVPLMIAGPGVVSGGRRVAGLVHVLDLFATVLQLSGAEPPGLTPAGQPIDSVSLVPYLLAPEQGSLRPWVMTELFGSTTQVNENGKAVRDEAYKLIRFDDGHDELYDLGADPQETNDLLTAGLSAEATEHHDALQAVLTQLLATE